MRVLLVILVVALSGCVADAQNDAAQAAQQAMQAAQLASQQAIQASQQGMQDVQLANQQAMQASQQAAQSSQIASQNTPPPGPRLTATPKFSAKQGAFSAPVTVTIRDASRGAIIYYTTDGWTPTVNSTRYKGPIAVDSNTTVQAIAIAPYSIRSFVATAEYSIKSQKAASSSARIPPIAPSLSADGKILIPKGTPVPLIFASAVGSRTASVGDKIYLTLADDLTVGTEIVAKKGSSASGTVIQVDKARITGLPGVVEFEVNSLNAHGVTIKLLGSAAKEGQAKLPGAAVLIPVVGIFTGLQHGTDAEIRPGATFTALVAEDATLTPAID
jgi:hypothetical protein